MESSSAEHQFVKRLNEIIDANLHDENFGVSELASELGMSRVTLHRKVKAVINKSVSSFIREARLERAKKLLIKKEGTVSEIAYKVGFGSVPYFIRAFHSNYGFTPGDVLKGIVPAEKPDQGEKHQSFLRKTVKPAVFIVPVVIVASLVIFMFLYQQKKKDYHTIAVLPFNTENQENKVLENANWIVMEIINKLERIDGISTIPYPILRNYTFSEKDISGIARELKVQFVLFSDIIESDDKLKISFDLIDGSNGSSVWSEIYDEYLNSENVGQDFGCQEMVATNVVGFVKGQISPVDKKQIEKPLSQNKKALDNYKLAVNLGNKPNLNPDITKQRKQLLEEAVALDTTFAEAYASLASIYSGNLWFTSNLTLSASYLDSAKLYYEKALYYDIENPKALRGLWKYYRIKGMDEQVNEIESRLPPFVENYLYYLNKFAEGSISFPSEKLINYYKYQEHLPEGVPTPWWMVHHLYYIYMRLGFPELAKKYANEEWLIRHTIPLPKYSFDNSWIEEMNGNYDSALVFLQKSDQSSTGNRAGFLMLAARNSMRNRDYETACVYLDSMELVHSEWLEMLSKGDARLIYPFGYSYIKTGQKEKGEHHLRGLIQKYEQEIEQNWVLAQDQFTQFELALAWSALGEKENSFRYLNRLVELHGCQLWFILELENNPMFDTIRGSEEYDFVLKEFKHNYNQEHQRIKKLVEKMGLEAA